MTLPCIAANACLRRFDCWLEYYEGKMPPKTPMFAAGIAIRRDNYYRIVLFSTLGCNLPSSVEDVHPGVRALTTA
ncbi:hypothetical protein ACTXT7_001754 [Hymenolepis weldensis]